LEEVDGLLRIVSLEIGLVVSQSDLFEVVGGEVVEMGLNPGRVMLRQAGDDGMEGVVVIGFMKKFLCSLERAVRMMPCEGFPGRGR
jgi:hypothetical protein